MNGKIIVAMTLILLCVLFVCFTRFSTNFYSFSGFYLSFDSYRFFGNIPPADWVLFSDIVGWQGNVTDYLDV